MGFSFSQNLVDKIRSTSFADCSATVVGCGYMGKEYVKALQTLGVTSMRVCARTEKSINAEVFTRGYAHFHEKPRENEWIILALPTAELIPAARHFIELGFRNFLIEKPVSFYSKGINSFLHECQKTESVVFSAYNRAAYPSLLEAREWAKKEGGITSCTYNMTEIVSKSWEERFSKEELSRWGVANSLHVASMVHGLIGLPKQWHNIQGNSAFSWHPSGSVFVGSGISKQNIPFSYYADWTSKSRWSIELHTREASYLLCPLEKLFRRTSFKEPWAEVPITSFNSEIKVGILEETAACLSPDIRKLVPLFSLEETIQLTKFGEGVFGYSSEREKNDA